ncbi:hypothetical protein P4C99_11110 [Pontiellaceae bacterium B1224]|nr:hypothetical protein [Pontiellaceae bacterium B1224]
MYMKQTNLLMLASIHVSIQVQSMLGVMLGVMLGSIASRIKAAHRMRVYAISMRGCIGVRIHGPLMLGRMLVRIELRIEQAQCIFYAMNERIASQIAYCAMMHSAVLKQCSMFSIIEHIKERAQFYEQEERVWRQEIREILMPTVKRGRMCFREGRLETYYE